MSKAEQQALAKGHFIDVLLQKKYWRTGSNEMVRRKDMSLAYKANALAYLIREARRIVDGYAFHPVFLGAPDDVWSDLEHVQEDPVEYILSTDMARALILDLFKEAELGPSDIGLERGSPMSRLALDGSFKEVNVWMEKP